VAGLARKLVFAARPAGGYRDNINHTKTLLAPFMGTCYDYIDNNIWTILLQLGLSFWLIASLCRLFGQSKKDRGTKNSAQQISKGAVHKIPPSRNISLYGCVSIDRSYFTDRPARPYTVDNPFFQPRIIAYCRQTR
jgi:hypothetical protein